MTILNLEVSTGGDDWQSQTGSFSTTLGTMDLGANATHDDRDGGYNYGGVSGLSGATINDAEWNTSTRSSELGTALTLITCNDVASPTNPTNQTEHNALARTTASIAFESYTFVANGQYMGGDASPVGVTITSVIQELADSHDPSEITVLIDDNGSSTSGNNYHRLRSFDHGSAIPSLDIDYTAASGDTWQARVGRRNQMGRGVGRR